MTFRGLSVKERQKDKSKDLLQSILLLECIDFIPQRRLKSIKRGARGCQIPQGGQLPAEPVLQVITSHNT